MKKIFSIIIFLILSITQISNSYGALTFGPKNDPCNEVGYILKNESYSHYHDYYGSIEYNKYGRPESSVACYEKKGLGSTGKIFGAGEDFLLSNNGFYYKGDGIKYIELPKDFLTTLVGLFILFFVHYLLFRSLKYIKKYKFLKITFGIIILLAFIFLGLSRDIFAGCPIVIEYYYDININGLLILFFFFSLFQSFLGKDAVVTYKNSLPNTLLIVGAVILYFFWIQVDNFNNPELITIYNSIWGFLSFVILVYYIQNSISLYRSIDKGIKFEKILIIFFILSLVQLLIPLSTITCR